MTLFSRNRLLLALLLAALAAGVSLAYGIAFSAAVDRLSLRADAQLSLASDRLEARLQAHRQLAVLLARHPGLQAVLSDETDQVLDRAATVLRGTADMTGAVSLQVVNPMGQVVVSSDGLPGSAGGERISSKAFRRAMHGALGTAHAFGQQAGRRAFYFAAPILDRGHGPRGAVIVAVDPEGIETDWRADPETILFTDNGGRVFLSNRSELLKGGAVAQPGDFTTRIVSGHELRRMHETRPGLPTEALWREHFLPLAGMSAEVWMDTAPARASALRQGALAGAILLVIASGLLILLERRAAVVRALEAEERLNVELEHRVGERTADLSRLNRDLTHEVAEREEAERNLRQTQRELVQAGKLSALGQMSAGISHELNQPLMAIRSFAENGQAFFDRGQGDKARDNLGRIADLAERMGRIIRNLRAFARNESEPSACVDLVAIVRAAIELSGPSLQGVTLNLTMPDGRVNVVGGEVRLSQVIVNLISNAVDAMAGQSGARLDLGIVQDADRVRLSVRDHGPGLADEARVFDPFYTTKEVGAANGMGLGLSISYGIVQSFGGQITGRNHPEGGAEFTVSLAPYDAQAAA